MIFDIECPSLNPDRIYCLSYYDEITQEEDTITDYDIMRDLLLTTDKLIGHNIIRFDIPVLERILGIDLSSKEVVDTLGLSWYLYNDRTKHGLEEWGTEFGVPKPKITDWNNLSIEEYSYRCSQDVKINTLLYNKQITYLNKLYNNRIKSILNYIRFKLECAREQEEIKWKLDVETCRRNLDYFEQEANLRIDNLSRVMPKVIKYKTVEKPLNMFKKNGEYTIAALNWVDLLYEHNLDEDYEGTIEVAVSESEGNPKSHSQMKDWLFSLGWEPDVFKNNEKNVRIPQINNDKNICNSIKKLYGIQPELANLESLYTINSRISILKGFLENQEDGYIKACIAGFTNTFRFKHKILVNLPKALEEKDPNSRKYYDGVYIRECLICEDDEYLCGSDMSSLEDTTKQHYIYKYDPEYIREMRTPGFDAHLDIAVLANMLTKEQAEDHKLYDRTKGKEGISYKPIRFKAKTTNFASTYKVGYKKLALTSGMTEEEAKELLKIFWQRNNSILKVERDSKIKTLGEDMWLYNPVSKLWYPLRYEKDCFSTLNQSTADYCFNVWVKEIRKRFKICGQFHDEVIIPIKKGYEEILKQYLYECIDRVNQILKLNVPLGISMDINSNYALIH